MTYTGIILFVSALPRNSFSYVNYIFKYSGADKSLARPGRKQATATEVTCHTVAIIIRVVLLSPYL